MQNTGVLAIATTPSLRSNLCTDNNTTKVRRISVISSSSSSSLDFSSTSSTDTTTTTTSTSNNNSLEQKNSLKFSYSRASPSVRWPHMKFPDNRTLTQQPTQLVTSPPPLPLQEMVELDDVDDDVLDGTDSVDEEEEEEEESQTQTLTLDSLDKNDESQEVLGRPSKTKKKILSKLALKRAADWRIRVQILTDKILELQPGQFVADVLDQRIVQMTPNDYCYVVKWVGMSNWQRALEVYEWLNIHHWFNPTGRMVATILSVLGKANQESIAEEIFTRADGGTENVVQVYNAMMGVYSRRGRFSKVQELLDLMQTRGCEPDLVSFNTLINARAKSGPMTPGLAMQLLDEVRKARLRPDTITYNTLISSCSRGSNLEEAVKIYRAMEASKCQPDLWTYNAMISVYSRCGMAWEADRLFQDLGSKGFFADAVTYNSLLYAFAREGNVEKVREICDQMVRVGYAKDEMTYNTIIHMHGKCGRHDLAWQTYRDMKLSGCNPDAITYTVLIDSLGKAGMIVQAAEVMSQMLDSGVKPTLRTFSALICGYAKAGMRVEAEETFCCMLRSGIKPDHLAYSVMLDILLRSNETKKAMSLYETMVRDGFPPDQGLYEVILQTLAKENRENDFKRVVKDMEKVFGMSPEIISSLLVKGECPEYAIKMLKLAVSRGYEPDRETLLSVLNSYESSGVQLEARALLDTLRKYAPRSNHLITEASILMLCKDHQLDAAMVEYNKAERFGLLIYESLIHCFKEAQSFEQASQVYSDMKFYGVEPSQTLYRSLVHIYCGMGFPETGHHLVDLAESSGIRFNDISIYVDLIEAYGKSKVWQGAESLVGRLRMKYSIVDRKIWNALIHVYAAAGRYEQARAVFSTMMRDGPSPTVESINGLMQALIVDERLPELYVVIQELQDMGFKISKSSILLMLDAFARAGNIFEVKKIYHGMKAAGYLPTMHLYRSMIQLLSRGKRIQDVEAMVLEMKEAGFKPDLSIFNSLLKLYTGIGNFKKTSAVYRSIQEAGLNADEDTYNTLILMYSRDIRPEEGLSLLHKMKQQGLTPKLDTYKSLMSACCKQQLWEQSEGLFEELRSKGFKLDRSVYHMMMKMYRDSANHLKAKSLLVRMKEEGVEPTIATMHLLMVSYGSARQPKEAENVLNTLKSSGVSLSTLPYSSVIDAYLKNGDSNLGIQKLFEMKEEGLEPDHRIWTCFIRAASLSQSTSGAMVLLNALRDTGFDLPVRLLTEKTESLVDEVDSLLEQLGPLEDNAAFNFVNALEDLLWAFERRATASWILQLAVKRSVYRHDMFRVADKDWGADFRKMSPGAALVGLTLWLDYMQDASLQGSPESPKSVVLITGMAEYNMVSLNNTVKAYLWEMGSPFLTCKTRSGLLIAKAHSLRMWLKDSPFCLDLELKDAPYLPELNSMQLSEGYFMRRGLVPVLKQINERLGHVRPKKFARLALLTDDQREKVIQADIDGRAEKLEKMKASGKLMRPKKKREKINRRWRTLN